MLLSPSSIPPVFPTSSVGLPPVPGTELKPYVFSITPLDERRLVLAHGSGQLTVVDQATAQVVDSWSCVEKEAEVSSVVVNAGAGSAGEVWTAGKDGVVRAWDSRVKGGRIEGAKSAGSMRGARRTTGELCRRSLKLTLLAFVAARALRSARRQDDAPPLARVRTRAPLARGRNRADEPRGVHRLLVRLCCIRSFQDDARPDLAALSDRRRTGTRARLRRPFTSTRRSTRTTSRRSPLPRPRYTASRSLSNQPRPQTSHAQRRKRLQSFSRARPTARFRSPTAARPTRTRRSSGSRTSA
jgi:hypothetical protein